MTAITEDQLRNWVSTPRLQRYMDNPADTVALYMYNAQLAADMSEVILHVEVLIRNVIHDRLRASSLRQNRGVPWYLDSQHYGFDRRMQKKLATAVSKAGGSSAPQGKVVAEIMFGTWRFLLTSRYNTKVWTAVAPGFRGKVRSQRSREELHDVMADLNEIRNRCSHSEPVYTESLQRFMNRATTAASYVDPLAADWIEQTWLQRRSGQTLPRRGHR